MEKDRHNENSTDFAEPQEWEWQLAEQEFLEHKNSKKASSNSFFILIITVFVIAAFAALSLPDLQMLVADRFDFMQDNRRLRNDQIVTTAKPAVVAIEAEVGRPLSQSMRQGTGFNIAPQGRIITNLHIIEDAKNIKVIFGDGRTFFTADYTVVEGNDIAIIDLNSNGLPVIEVDSSGRPHSNEEVTIIGNPLGLQKIAQRGQVGQYHLTQANQALVFDVNVPAHPGNSGSPVLNEQAQVVGIVFASTEMKIGERSEIRTLAIPINVMQDITSQE